MIVCQIRMKHGIFIAPTVVMRSSVGSATPLALLMDTRFIIHYVQRLICFYAVRVDIVVIGSITADFVCRAANIDMERR